MDSPQISSETFVLPIRRPVKIERPTESATPSFAFSELTPSRLEEVSFTPKCAPPAPSASAMATATTLNLGDPLSMHKASNEGLVLEKVLLKIASLEERLKDQEGRLQGLMLAQRQHLTIPATQNNASTADLLDSCEAVDSESIVCLCPSPAPRDTVASTVFDMRGFEEIFEKPSQQPTGEISLQKSQEHQTLLEGIGSADHLTHHKRIDSRSKLGSLGPGTGLDPPNRPVQSDSTFSVPKDEPIPWNGEISWKTSLGFASGKERDDALIYQPHNADRSLFRDNLIYRPRPADVNVYRTVAVLNLPDDINMETFLQGVRGGDVYSAHLHNTLYISGSHTGIVTFIFQRTAVAYAEFAAKNGVFFNGKRARVVLYKTPTYPLSASMEANIFDFGYTRCLSIQGNSDSERFAIVSKFLKDNILMYVDLGDRMLENKEETEIIIRFNSIQAAGDALARLENFPPLYNCDIDFEKDPCSAPLPGSNGNQGPSRANEMIR